MSPIICPRCNVAKRITVTETFIVLGRQFVVTLCMRCWLEEHRE